MRYILVLSSAEGRASVYIHVKQMDSHYVLIRRVWYGYAAIDGWDTWKDLE